MTKISMLILGCLGAAAAIGLAVFSPREPSHADARPQLTSTQAKELKPPETPASPPAAQRIEVEAGDDPAADYSDAEDGHGS
jgi:hypothetical protein